MDALGFQPMCMLPVAILAILIAVQGFSYLYDRKKVDMYHSVPVSAKRRFAVIYLNGFLMYIIPALFGICIGILMAAAQGSLTIRCLAECGLAFILNLFSHCVPYDNSGGYADRECGDYRICDRDSARHRLYRLCDNRGSSECFL